MTRPQFETATVMARHGGGAYLVRVGDEQLTAVLRGKLKQGGQDRVVVGDTVQVERHVGSVSIAGVDQRRSLLVRRMAGGRRAGKPVAANLDQVVIVTAARDPDPVVGMLDRFLVIAESNGLPAVLVVNKVDLDPQAAEALERRFGRAGYRILRTSARGRVGLADFQHLLRSKVSLLTGPSGVGKSSLLNAVQPGLSLKTGPLGRKSRGGTHTTTTAEMLPLELGGYVVDSPGFSDVELWDVDVDALGGCFPEFRPFLDGCRFNDCRHVTEPGCAVRGAVESGAVGAERLESYCRLLAEVSVPSWSSGRRRGF
jgi:ribosome biogenesis GTPase / thiamine phosphate phosphatase